MHTGERGLRQRCDVGEEGRHALAELEIRGGTVEGVCGVDWIQQDGGRVVPYRGGEVACLECTITLRRGVVRTLV